MRYTETNDKGIIQRELTFEGAEEAVLAYRGALFSGDRLLADRVRRQMNHVFEECNDSDRNIYREEGLFFMDRDAQLILGGLRKQINPVDSPKESEYVHPHRSAQMQFMFKQAGVSLEEVPIRTSFTAHIKKWVPRPRIATAEVAA